MSFQPRYDEERGIYRDCKFCKGKGCLACPTEADKEYKRQFPDGPQPIATFDTSALGEKGLGKLLSDLLGPKSIKAAHAEAGHRAEDIIKDAPYLAELVGHPLSEVKAVLTHSLTTEVLTENIVKASKAIKKERKGK